MRINGAIGGATLALTVSLLAGCGSSGGGGSHASGDYCQQLKDDKTFFGSLSGSSASSSSNFDEVFSRMHTLAKSAPSSVAADWKTLDNAITTIQNAFKQAGLKPSDLASLQAGKTPPGVNLSKLQALAPKLEALSSSDVTAAADRISKDAKSTCGVDLSAS